MDQATLEVIIRVRKQLDGMEAAIRQTRQFGQQFGATARSIQSYARKIVASVAKMQAAIKKLRDGFRTLRNVALKAFTALVAFTGIPIKFFANFEQKMANVNTLLDVSEKKFRQMGQGVIEISNRIGESAETLSTALYDIVSAGVDAGNSLSVLDLSARAAKAGMTQAQTAVNAGLATVNSYNLAISDLSHVFDLQFQTVRKGVLTYEQLSSAQGQLLPSARKLNESLENMYGSLAFVTKQGLSAELASVSLARAYDGLIEKSDKLAAAGVQVYDEFGNFRGIVDIVEDLAEKLEGLSDEQMQGILQSVGFEIRAARAIIPMIKNIDGLRESIEAMNNSSGAMEEAFTKATDTISFRFNRAKENIINSIREMGKGWRPEINDLFDRIAAWGRSLQDFVTNNKEAIKSVLTFAIKLTAIVSAVAIVGTAILSLMTPIGAVVAGITLLASAWYLNLWDIRGTTRRVIDYVLGKWEKLNDWWEQSDLAQLIRDTWGEVIDIWTSDELTLPEKALETVNLTVKTIGKLIESIGSWWLEQTIKLAKRGAEILGLDPDKLWIVGFLIDVKSIWNDSTLTFGEKTAEILKLTPGGKWLLNLVSEIKTIWNDKSLSLPEKIVGISVEVFVEAWKGGQKILDSFWNWLKGLFGYGSNSIEEQIEREVKLPGLGELLQAIYTAEGGVNASVPYGTTGFKKQGYQFALASNQEFFDGLEEALKLEPQSKEWFAAASATTVTHYWENFKNEFDLAADVTIAGLSKDMRDKFIDYLGSDRYAWPSEHEIDKNWPGNVKSSFGNTLNEQSIQVEPLDIAVDFTVSIGAIAVAFAAGKLMAAIASALVAEGALVWMGAKMAAGTALTLIGGSALALAGGLTVGAALSILFDPEVEGYEDWKEQFQEGLRYALSKEFWQDLWTIAKAEWQTMWTAVQQWTKDELGKFFTKEYWLGIWEDMKEAWTDTWDSMYDSMPGWVQKLLNALGVNDPIAGLGASGRGSGGGGGGAWSTGGQVFGTGTGTSDSIAAWLSNGEFVVNAQATRKWLPVLKAINSGEIPKFAGGGYAKFVGGSSYQASNMSALKEAGLEGNKVLYYLAQIARDTSNFSYVVDLVSGVQQMVQKVQDNYTLLNQEANDVAEKLKEIRDNTDPGQNPADTKVDWNNFVPELADILDSTVQDLDGVISNSTAALLSGITSALRSFASVEGGFAGAWGEIKSARGVLSSGGGIQNALGELSQGTVSGITSLLDGIKNSIIAGAEEAARKAAEEFEKAIDKFNDAVAEFKISISQGGSLQAASYDYKSAIEGARNAADTYATKLAKERRADATKRGGGIGGLLGGIIGFLVGGPAGAAIGAGLGGVGGAAIGALGDYYKDSDYQKKLAELMVEVKKKINEMLEQAFGLDTTQITANLNQAIMGAVESGKDLAVAVGTSLYGQIKDSMQSVFLWAQNNIIQQYLEPVIEGMKTKITDAITSGQTIDFNNLVDIEGLIQAAQSAEQLAGNLQEFTEELKQQLIDAGIDEEIINALFPPDALTQQVMEALRNAMGAAMDSGNFLDFTKTLGQSVYDNAKQGLIQAFMESAVYQEMFAQWFDASGITFTGNLEEDFAAMQGLLDNLEDQLRTAGLDFNYTEVPTEPGGSSGGGDLYGGGSYYTGDSNGSGGTIINKNYYIEVGSYIGADKEEVAREMRELIDELDDDEA